MRTRFDSYKGLKQGSHLCIFVGDCSSVTLQFDPDDDDADPAWLDARIEVRQSIIDDCELPLDNPPTIEGLVGSRLHTVDVIGRYLHLLCWKANMPFSIHLHVRKSVG